MSSYSRRTQKAYQPTQPNIVITFPNSFLCLSLIVLAAMLQVQVEPSSADPNYTLLSGTALGVPATAANTLFWADSRYGPSLASGPTGGSRPGSSIYGYNVSTQSQFLVYADPLKRRRLPRTVRPWLGWRATRRS